MLQQVKVRGRAYLQPGKHSQTFVCKQEWLVRAGCSDADITSIKEGFKEALGKAILAVLSFRDFARTFSWFASTLHMMSQVEDHHTNGIYRNSPTPCRQLRTSIGAKLNPLGHCD